MQTDELIAFVAGTEPDRVEIRVNFGLVAGREATPAELDALAHTLLPEVGEVTVVAEHRHEHTEAAEMSVHQVRVEVDGRRLPTDPVELATATERLRRSAAEWAQASAADRQTEVSEPL